MATKTICGIIPVRREDIVGYRSDGYLAECVMPRAHYPHPHVLRTPEGRYFAWEVDDECGCCDPGGGDPDQCYDYWEISAGEAEEFMESK